ncbi:shikimate kinase [Romboutsia sedimentorum]|uniref:Shikimate kinase n=1 Tax=Romboutsia sedimentorum TaxID=1368474 RepID=A0ABT7E8E8_9FIRM|nr:shikimate kinase [Romboutsia sedimentorum]MDK2563204.1 shikimate kinase [Romboutsia sedimentorum]MDK2584931.1 shikimate kinase [Romboutsia sedimentorum]
MRIILIGFMGVGKTVVGKSLAKNLSIKFIDMDNEIEKRENKIISDIFKESGEEYFRKLENDLLKELVKQDNIIISTGGGIITKQENIDILKQERKVVFLDANVWTIQKNVSKEINKRPLLKQSENIAETIDNLLKKRINKYNDTYNIKIDINDKNINEVVSEILVHIG